MSKELEQLESVMDQKEVIVIDNGTNSIKIGYSGEDQPRIEMESIGGTFSIKDEADSISSKKQQYLFGNNLQQSLIEQKYDIQINNMISRSSISNFEYMGYFWEYILEQVLQCNEVSACNILIVDSAANSKFHKQEMARILFEQVKVHSLLFMNSSVSSLLSTGYTTGLVIESGEGTTNVTPIFEGYPIYHAQNISRLAGQDVTECLKQELMKLDNFDINRLGKTAQSQSEIIRNIKESLCHSSLDYNYDLNFREELNTEEKSYELPDGSILEISKQIKYKPAEVLFNPELVGIKENSLSYMLRDSLERCDAELVNELLRQVVICGGNTNLYNFPSRLRQELLASIPSLVDPQDIVYDINSQRKNNSWVGASMVGSLGTFQQLAILKSEYDENPENKINLILKKTF